MQLNKVQKRFKDTMLGDASIIQNPDEDFAALFVQDDIPLPDRLKVYRNNVAGGITSAMIETFPIMEKLVGEEFLRMMTESFVIQNPPESGCLDHYGHGFNQFIADYELAQAMPYLPDIARFEIAINDAYHAADDEVLKAEELATIAPEDLDDLTIKLRASVTLLSSDFPLTEIRDFCLKDDKDDSKTLNIDTDGEHIMVYRPQLKTEILKIDEPSYAMLTTLQEGQPLGETVETVMNKYENFDFQLFLQSQIELETFLSLGSNA